MNSENSFAYDAVFSHSQPVRRLIVRLKAAEVRVWSDEWVIQAGAP